MTSKRMKTSIGHHTFTMSRRIICDDYIDRDYYKSGRISPRSRAAMKLLRDVVDYMCKSGEIDIHVPIQKTYHWRPANRTKLPNGKVDVEHHGIWKIVYTSEYLNGLSWILRYNTHSADYREYIIEARINPKVFVGIKDYITASDSRYLLEVEKKFNEEAKKISPLLGQFCHYKPKRIDFCINFDLKELGILCTPEQMMWLIKRGDYPSHFKELQYYDKVSHRMKSPCEYSHYLKSGATNINCYYKYHQLIKDFPDCPNIEDAQHIIRFEVQYKYSKTYLMYKFEQERLREEEESRYREHRECKDFNAEDSSENMIYKRLDTDPLKIIHNMLSDETAEDVIKKYFRQMIRPGDYYTLAEAISRIEDASFNPTVEQVIIDTLESINRIGIARTRALLETQPAKMRFYKTLEVLAKLNINPVTIPKSFKLRHIPNLLEAFYKLRDTGNLDNAVVNNPYEPLDMPNDSSDI